MDKLNLDDETQPIISATPTATMIGEGLDTSTVTEGKQKVDQSEIINTNQEKIIPDINEKVKEVSDAGAKQSIISSSTATMFGQKSVAAAGIENKKIIKSDLVTTRSRGCIIS